jgi:hypothetical protein
MSVDPAKPTCKLIGEDGNVFWIIGRVRKALRESGQEGRAREFVDGHTGQRPTMGCCRCAWSMWRWCEGHPTRFGGNALALGCQHGTPLLQVL